MSVLYVIVTPHALYTDYQEPMEVGQKGEEGCDVEGHTREAAAKVSQTALLPPPVGAQRNSGLGGTAGSKVWHRWAKTSA